MSINFILESRYFLFLSYWKNHISLPGHQVSRLCSTDHTGFKPNDVRNHSGEVYDLVVVGGGIVGITTARAALIEKPNLKVAVLEKEPNVAMHQSSHNSGVIHAGIYYAPDTLKAKFCVAGLKATYEFCEKYNIPIKKCGKIVVATNDTEVYFLKKLYKNALINEAPDVEYIDSEKIKELEPCCQGINAIYSPHTGITDWALLTKFCAKEIQDRGGRVFCNFEVSSIREAKEGTKRADVSSCPIEFSDPKYPEVVKSKYAIACGGLHSDRLAHMAQGLHEPVIIPFRGEYLELKEEKCHLVRGNIYPVPDPRFPFLGVHFTPTLDGRVLLGPNAVLALSREGYSWKQVNKHDIIDMLKFNGFYKLLDKYTSLASREILKSLFKSLQVKELQKYVPEISSKDVVYKGFSGVRAQALDCNGSLVDDLIIQLGTDGIDARILHVRNAPSPAATSSLALSEYIIKSANVDFEY